MYVLSFSTVSACEILDVSPKFQTKGLLWYIVGHSQAQNINTQVFH